MDVSTIAISLCSGILLTMISQFIIRGINGGGGREPAHTCGMHDIAFTSLSREMGEVKTLLKDAHDEIFRRLRAVEESVAVLKDRGAVR